MLTPHPPGSPLSLLLSIGPITKFESQHSMDDNKFPREEKDYALKKIQDMSNVELGQHIWGGGGGS